ncbi:MAG: hypothetical protein HY593_03420 [Candidatus Omnitrophica bacterium]|nr:hypothetical protein [Candidatus Omnitrophota bacterium]
MKYFILRSFDKKFDAYHRQEQEAITSTLKEIKNFLETRHASYGLRIKRLSDKIYEARINIHLRIAYWHEGDTVKFFCLGNHDDIRNCLKNLAKLG